MWCARACVLVLVASHNILKTPKIYLNSAKTMKADGSMRSERAAIDMEKMAVLVGHFSASTVCVGRRRAK